jgi:hypothetical protein
VPRAKRKERKTEKKKFDRQKMSTGFWSLTKWPRFLVATNSHPNHNPTT